MQVNSVIHGFRVVNVRHVAELEGKLWQMEHEKTGAQLCWLDRPDENKSFGIAFKTIPEDSTGVFHILEHSVLCGSDKYPVKEPFVELLKSSVQTFLNAMTYPDKTVYPISSRNDQDFLNLLDVYMDAVLHPAIYHKPEIFRQEGWRYELQESGQPVYQGVVFNEMKGAYASSEEVMSHALMQLMFPDNCYSFESGGHPEAIPDLTYEQFIANHQKYYHPSNSRIFLVGQVPVEDALRHIDDYLAPYEKQSAHFPIPMQQPVAYREEKTLFEIGVEESPENRTIVACGHVLGKFDDQEKIYAAIVLRDYLAGDNDAPLKQAILSAGLGQDVKVNVLDGIQQPTVSWEVWNTEEDKVEAIKTAVNKVFTDLADNGLDRNRLEASFNRFAFRLRDKDGGWAGRSLSEGLTMLDSWLYDGDPIQYLLVEDTLNALEAKLDTTYYQNLIRELFLDNAHKAMAILVPSQTLGKEKQEKEAARIAAEYAAWTQEDHVKYQQMARELAAWQQTPDSAEALATIPMLKLSDIDTKAPELPVQVSQNKGVTLLTHETDGSLVYMNLHFDASDLTEEELSAAALLASLLGKLPTANHSSAELQMLVKQKIGSLNIRCNVDPGKDPASCAVRVSADVVALANQSQSAAELLGEILTQTLFQDKEQLKNLLNQTMMQCQMQFVGGGHMFASTRAASFLTSEGAVREIMSGSTYIRYIRELTNADDVRLDALLAQLKSVAEKVFASNRLTLSVSSNVDAALRSSLVAAFPAGTAAAGVCTLAPRPVTQVGLPIPAPVGFAAKASHLKLHGKAFHGSIHVLANLLRFSYLWNEIRVQGGAYGCGFTGQESGTLFFHTYRDPQPGRSLDVFDRAAEFVRSFCAEKPDLTAMILGALSSADPLLNTRQKISVAENRYFRGVSYEDVCRVLEELLSTSAEDLLALADTLEELAKDNAVCVVAGQSLLDACGDKLTAQEQIL